MAKMQVWPLCTVKLHFESTGRTNTEGICAFVATMFMRISGRLLLLFDVEMFVAVN